MHVPCTCNVHPRSAFSKVYHAPFISHRSTESDVSGLKFHQLRGSQVIQFSLWHVLRVPLSTSNLKVTYPPGPAICSQSLSHVCRLVWPAAWKKRCKFCARAQHMQCAPQVIFYTAS